MTNTDNGEDLSTYAGDNRGCRLDFLPTSRECPDCGKRLRLVGRLLTSKLRLQCTSCGYAGSILSREELGELL